MNTFKNLLEQLKNWNYEIHMEGSKSLELEDVELEINGFYIVVDFKCGAAYWQDKGDYLTPPSSGISSKELSCTVKTVWEDEDEIAVSQEEKNKLQVLIEKATTIC